MKKVVIIFLLLVAIALTSCNISSKTESSEVFNDTKELANITGREELTEKEEITDNTVTDSIVTKIDNVNGGNYQDVRYDRVFINTENICFENDDSSFSFIGSLRDITEYKTNGVPMWKCAIIKFIPMEYKFIFIKQSGDVYPGGYYYGGYAILVSEITEIFSMYNGFDIQQTDNVNIKQYIKVTPSDEYMNYFVKRYGNEDEGIKSIPDGIYELEKDKLIEMGIADISAKGSPILEYNKEYCAFVTEESDGVTLSDSLAYCDINLEPVEIKIKNTRYGWEYKNWSSELIEMIKELKK
jgi:hypothetical protein